MASKELTAQTTHYYIVYLGLYYLLPDVFVFVIDGADVFFTKPLVYLFSYRAIR